MSLKSNESNEGAPLYSRSNSKMKEKDLKLKCQFLSEFYKNMSILRATMNYFAHNEDPETELYFNNSRLCKEPDRLNLQSYPPNSNDPSARNNETVVIQEYSRD